MNRPDAGECKKLGFQEITLDYDRQAYGCRHYACVFTSLDTYMDHLIQWCRPSKVSGKGYPSFQIRALLKQPAIISRAEELCKDLWGSAHALNDLWWHYDAQLMQRTIEMLEFGEMDVGNEALPRGIRKDDVDDFLYALINQGKEQRPPISQTAPSSSTTDMQPTPESLTWMAGHPGFAAAEEASMWNSSATVNTHRSSAAPTQHPRPVATLPMHAGPRWESPTSFTGEVAHRQKRPLSIGTSQHPEATRRAASNPFATEPARPSTSQAVQSLHQFPARHWSSHVSDFHGASATSIVGNAQVDASSQYVHHNSTVPHGHLSLPTTASDLLSMPSLRVAAHAVAKDDIDLMLDQFPAVPGPTRTSNSGVQLDPGSASITFNGPAPRPTGSAPSAEDRDWFSQATEPSASHWQQDVTYTDNDEASPFEIDSFLINDSTDMDWGQAGEQTSFS